MNRIRLFAFGAALCAAVMVIATANDAQAWRGNRCCGWGCDYGCGCSSCGISSCGCSSCGVSSCNTCGSCSSCTTYYAPACSSCGYSYMGCSSCGYTAQAAPAAPPVAVQAPAMPTPPSPHGKSGERSFVRNDIGPSLAKVLQPLEFKEGLYAFQGNQGRRINVAFRS